MLHVLINVLVEERLKSLLRLVFLLLLLFRLTEVGPRGPSSTWDQ